MKGKDLVSRFKKEGWTLDRVRGSHHVMIKDDKTVVVPVHNKELEKGILSKLLKEAGLK